jgi:uncharacterized protein (DUF58 family)
MSQLFDSDFLKKLQQLVITSKVILTDGGGGNRKSRSKGSSVEFSDYREYTLGDDFRRIDWNAYGRFEKLFIKLFMEEREAPVNLFLDTSKSMDWGEPNKSMASRRLAAALCYISLSNYDRVSIACLSNTVEKMKLSLRGKNSFGDVLDMLEKLEYNRGTDLLAAIRQFNLKPSRGISIIISDFLSQGALEESIKYLQYRKQEVYVCHVLAPQEVNPEINSSLRLIDKETGEYMDVTASPQLVKAYHKVFTNFTAGLEEVCFKRGASYMRFESSVPVETMVKKVVGG